jgi:predicted acetyltransferase
VVDHWAPWNEGRWRLHADAAGCAEVERTDAEADLRLPIEALGAAYLGAGNVHALARAGLVAEHRPGAARDLWRALRTDVAPTGAVGF